MKTEYGEIVIGSELVFSNEMTNMDTDYKDEDTMAGVYNAWSECEGFGESALRYC